MTNNSYKSLERIKNQIERSHVNQTHTHTYTRTNTYMYMYMFTKAILLMNWTLVKEWGIEANVF